MLEMAPRLWNPASFIMPVTLTTLVETLQTHYEG
jgi:hypothetical protein